jgi:hypothetical protein
MTAAPKSTGLARPISTALARPKFNGARSI